MQDISSRRISHIISQDYKLTTKKCAYNLFKSTTQAIPHPKKIFTKKETKPETKTFIENVFVNNNATNQLLAFCKPSNLTQVYQFLGGHVCFYFLLF